MKMIQSIRGVRYLVVLVVFYLSSTTGWLLQRPLVHNTGFKVVTMRHKYHTNNIYLRCVAENSPGGDSSTNEDDNDIELEIDDADKTSKKGVEEIVIEDENESSPPETAAEDPETAARKKIEQQLRYELSKAEGLLRNERIQLSKTRDKISESGKNGFFLVKAQVNDFLRTKDIQQKELIAQKRRDVVLKLLPILDKFRSTPQEIPAETKRELNMHESFNALLRSILIVIERYGYQETEAAPGEAVDLSKHEVVGSEESEQEGVISTVRKGMLDNKGIVLRKAQVIVGKKVKSTESHSAPEEQT